MKRVLTILFISLFLFSSATGNVVQAQNKSVEKLNNVGQIDNSNESYQIVYEEVTSRVFYGENGIDIINENGTKHFDTKFKVLKLSVVNDLNGDGYPEFLTYQGSPSNTDQIFVINGQDGSIITSFRLTYDSYDSNGNKVVLNSSVYKFIEHEGRNFILYDYSLCEYDLTTGELKHSYVNDDNIWDVEFYNNQIFFVDQLGQLGFLNSEDLSLVGKRVVSNQYTVSQPWNESTKLTAQMNLWDIQIVNDQLYFISEDGYLYHYLIEEDSVEANPLAIVDSETFQTSLTNNYNYDGSNVIQTNSANSTFMNYKIVDSKDSYLLIRCYFLDNEAKCDSVDNSFQCFVLYNLDTNEVVYKYDYASQADRAYGVFSQRVNEEEVSDTITIALASDATEKITVYDYQGQVITQKEMSLGVGDSSTKFKFSYQEDGSYFLEGFNNGACFISNDLSKVTYPFDKQNAELVSSSSDEIVVSYKLNDQTRKLVAYQTDGTTVKWSYETSGNNHGIEYMTKVDYNLDGVVDYALIVNNYNSKGEQTDSNVIIINGKDGSKIDDSRILLDNYYDEYGRNQYLYASISSISFVKDLDGDGKREMLIPDGVVSSKNFRLKGSYSSYFETKGNIFEIGDANGDGFTDYLTISDSRVELFTSRISYTYNVEYKRYDYFSIDSQYKNGTYGAIFEDINGDGVKEFVLNCKNEKGYQVFNVYNGANLNFMYTLCSSGVSDYEYFKVLDIDVNGDGYKEIFNYSGSTGLYALIDGSTGEIKKRFDYWSSESDDNYEYVVDTEDYYHPDYFIEFMIDASESGNIISYKDVNGDGHNDVGIKKSYYDYTDWTSTTSLFIYDSQTYEYIEEIVLANGNDYSTNVVVTVNNTDGYLVIKKDSSFQLYDMAKQMVVAEYSLTGSTFVLINDQTLLMGDDNKNIYLLDIQKSFDVNSDVPTESDEHILHLDWTSLQEYSTMSIYDNGKLVASTTGNEYDITLTEGEHTISLSLDDGQGKKAKESYTITISEQKNQDYYLVPIAGVLLVGSLLANLGRKTYINKKGKEGLSK